MADVITQFYLSDTNTLADNKGNVIPGWSDGSRIFFDSPDNYNFAYSIYGDTCYIQYGFNKLGWASIRCFRHSLRIEEQETLSDGSVNVKFILDGLKINTYKTDYTSGIGYAVNYQIYQMNNLEYTFNGSTVDEWNYTSPNSYSETVNIKPSSRYDNTAIHLIIRYPNHEYEDYDLKIGFTLYNTLPPTYIPNFVKKNNVGDGLNISGRNNVVILNQNITILPRENTSTINTDNGKNRVTKNGVRKQARAYFNNGVIS